MGGPSNWHDAIIYLKGAASKQALRQENVEFGVCAAEIIHPEKNLTLRTAKPEYG